MNVIFIKPLTLRLLRICFLLIFIFGHQKSVMSIPKESLSKSGLTLYVSINGNDSWSGKLRHPNENKSDGPFATIVGARNMIRIMKSQKQLPKGKIVVEIQEGTYELSDVFNLEEEDGGINADSQIVYRGQQEKKTLLSGGKQVMKWDLVTDEAVLNKFKAEVRKKIYQSDLSSIGINDFGSPEGKGIELFFNNEPMKISRYPNKGFIKITGLFNEEPVDIRGTKGDKIGKFNYDDLRINKWKDEKDAWVGGYWFWDWAEQKHKVSKIDTESLILEVDPPYHSYGYRLGQWFYGFNLLSEIDEPGEYYVDRIKGIIYFYPPADILNGHAYVSINKNIINLKKVSFLTIQDVTMEGSRETVVKMEDCISSSIVGCTIRNSGDEGVVIAGGSKNSVVGCDIYGLGAGGIRIDAGNIKTLEPGNCFADNNNIHHIARIKRVYFPGISLNGVGNRATHNLIKHLPHIAIFFIGNDHLLEFNEIYDVCFESNDAGAIYTGRSWIMRGNKIRYNYLHDISGFEGKGCVGIYLDDAFCGVKIIGNVFDNVTRAMMIGGGRDNSVLNNIFINCIPSVHVDARSMGWMEFHADGWIKEEKEKGTISEIFYNKPPYSIRYPELVNLINDEPKAPKGNIISRNICQGGAWDKNIGFWRISIEDKARPYLVMEDNIVAPNSAIKDSSSNSFVILDPLFINHNSPEDANFQLSEDSPALLRGFKQIPFDKIGLYKSNDRASWPISK